MKIKDLKELLVHELKDLLGAERQLLKALPKMAAAAAYPRLKQTFDDHLVETEEQVVRLEKLLASMDQKTSGTHCAAMEGLIAEGADMIDGEAPAFVKDAGLISCAQRVEHYELAAYGCARAYARELGLEHVVKTLTLSFEEELSADQSLTEIAEAAINPNAVASNRP